MGARLQGERVKGTRKERGVGMLPHLAAPVEEILDMFQIWAESLSIGGLLFSFAGQNDIFSSVERIWRPQNHVQSGIN